MGNSTETPNLNLNPKPLEAHAGEVSVYVVSCMYEAWEKMTSTRKANRRCVHAHTHTHIYIYTHIRTCLHVYSTHSLCDTCEYACMHACILHTYIHIYIYTKINKQIYIYIYAYIPIYLHTRPRMHTCMHNMHTHHTCVTYLCAYVFVYVYAYVCVYIRMYVHRSYVYKHINKYACTCT